MTATAQSKLLPGWVGPHGSTVKCGERTRWLATPTALDDVEEEVLVLFLEQGCGYNLVETQAFGAGGVRFNSAA